MMFTTAKEYVSFITISLLDFIFFFNSESEIFKFLIIFYYFKSLISAHFGKCFDGISVAFLQGNCLFF